MAHTILVILLLATAALFSPTLCESMEYYVTPTPPPNIDCPPGPPCHTLDYYAQNTSLLSGQDNASLLFLEGEHLLSYNLSIANTTGILIACLNCTKNTSNRVIVKGLQNVAVISFENVTLLRIENVELHGNKTIQLKLAGESASFYQTVLNRVDLCIITKKNAPTCDSCNSSMILKLPAAISKRSLSLEKVEISNGYIYHLYEQRSNSKRTHLFVSIKNCTLDRSTLSFYRIGPHTVVQINITHTTTNRLVQVRPYGINNTITFYIFKSTLEGLDSALQMYTGAQMDNVVTLNITDSKIGNSEGAGIRAFLDTVNANQVKIYINNCTVHDNTFGVRIDLFTSDFGTPWQQKCTKKTDLEIRIHNTRFEAFQSAIISEFPTYVNVNFNLSITNCVFESNKKVLQLKRNKEQVHVPPNTMTSHLTVLVRNSTIRNCQTPNLDFAVITVTDTNMTIIDSTFIGNRGTSVDAYFSDITLSGETVFRNNSGIKGGAMSLHHSFLYISGYSSILFTDNHAKDVGGAIYLKQFPQLWTTKQPPCFYQIGENQNTRTTSATGVCFHNNTAVKGGDDIYGGSLFSPCTIFNYVPYQIQFIEENFNFTLHNKTSLTSVSSDPTRVCLCDDHGRPRCADIDYIYRELPPRYPGELFTVSAVVVGSDFGTVPGIIHAKLSGDTNVSLAENQYLQQISDHFKCSPLQFSLQSPVANTVQTITLQASPLSSIADKRQVTFDINWQKKFQIIHDSLLYHPVLLNVTLQDCPIGLVLPKTPPFSCKCDVKLIENDVSECGVLNYTGWVNRTGTVWVSASFTENETDQVLINKNCPYDFCNTAKISVSLQYPDKQCSFNRSGILCGGCYGNLSLALGSSRCLPCDNRSVSLLLVFILAGFVLVFFIKVLDLTVAKGTINGLIFYANVVWANKSILFPATETLHPVQQILQTFIAWLNLDLGIETCFINGLDAYWKTWLQFVFPLYIWAIIGALMVASKYSTRASKIFGNNSVPVLATLILLSYAKLLRTIMTALGFSLLDYEQGTKILWSFDGNVLYFGVAHIILFLVAIAALLLLWLPYTTVLLTLQWLRRKSNFKPLRWINRWKPFFDAYFGQLKPKHQYWVGLLLLVRVFLLITLATTSGVAPKINILIIASMGVILLGYKSTRGAVYKKRHLSLIENLFIMNITLLAAVTLYMGYTQTTNSAILYTSIAIAFVKFLMIVIYHIFCRFNYYCMAKKGQQMADVESSSTQKSTATEMTLSAPNYLLDSSQFREPLLDD